MKKKIFIGIGFLAVLAVVLFLCIPKDCEHKWVTDDCLEPLVCSECGEVGDAPGHIWSETTPIICVKCGDPQIQEVIEDTKPDATAEPAVTPAPAKVSKDEMMANVAPEHREDFELVIADKIANGINDYTYEDYLAVLEKEKEKEEESSKINVEDVEDINANKEAIKQTIIKDIARYNQYIYDHCGYSEVEYGDGPHAKEADPNLRFTCLYSGVMEYMDMLIDYSCGKRSDVWGSEMYKSLDEQIKEVRGTMFNGIQYVQSGPSDRFPDYNFILANFLSDGHPDITSVENLSLEKVNEIMDFDSHQVGVIASFTCNGTKYTCWLESTSMSVDGAYYTVLDLKKN